MAQGEQDAVTAASEDMAPPQVVPSSIPPWALLLVAFAVAQATTMLAAIAVSAVGPVLDPFLRSLAEASVPRAGTLEIDRAAGLVLHLRFGPDTLMLGVVAAGLVAAGWSLLLRLAGLWATGGADFARYGLFGWYFFLATVILVPVAEELVFRGWLFAGLERVGLSRTRTVVLTALASSFAQMPSDLTLIYYSTDAALGFFNLIWGIAQFLHPLPTAFILGSLRAESGSLVPPIAAHMAGNALVFLNVFGP